MANQYTVASDLASLTSGEHAAAVTPHDDNDLTATTRALWIGGAGALSVIMSGGETVTFAGIAAGTLLPLEVTRVLDTNTDATNIVAIW